MIEATLATCVQLDDRHLFGIMIAVAVVVLVASFRRPSRRCPRCQQINREQAVYCAQCGERLPGR